MAQRLSRKKLSEEEALEKMANLYMQLQNEQEALMINYYPNRHKPFHELDKVMQLVLTIENVQNVEECIFRTEERVKQLEWKINEDYGRFVSPGVHRLASGHLFIKAGEENATI